MKIFFYNLGCKVNAYEVRAVVSSFLKRGYTLGDINHFDVALVDTCTVTHVSSQKSRQHIRKLRRLKPKAIIIVMGCYTTNNSESIVRDCGADIVVGINNYQHVYSLVNEFKKNHKPIIKVDSKVALRKKANYEELGIANFNEQTRAYVKISDGCNNFCSYCIIPLIRGRLRSRDPKMINCEIKELIKRGYKEIVLAGVDTSSYRFKNYDLPKLLDDILRNNPKLFRLRLSSIEISEINDKFLKVLKKYPNFANHLHLSLQSGSDSVLKRMKRKYNTKEFLKKVNEIRKVRKDIALTTDVIVGFPGETDQEFNETCAFIKKVKFYELHVFPFSKREGTAAYLMEDVDPRKKKERVNKLLELNKKLRNDYMNKFIGRELDVLFEANHTGLTSNYLRVKANYPINQIKKVRLRQNNLC